MQRNGLGIYLSVYKKKQEQKQINASDKNGATIQWGRIKNLTFADDIVLIAESP